MKKFTSIAAALCLATAFCGMCAGCANGIKDSVDDLDENSAVSTAADSQAMLILCPGYAKGYGSTANTIASGATKLTEAQEQTYYVSNAYFADVTTGAELPEPSTTRTDVKFNGWRRAEDGELKTYTVMPKLSETTFFYAEWVTNGNGGGGGGGDDPTPVPTGVTLNGKAMEKNAQPMAGVDEEYMSTGVALTAGALTFKVNGSTITIDTFDAASTGLTFSGGTVSVAKDGTFDIYLKKKGTKWEVYGARDTSQDVTSIRGEVASAGNVYLAGNVTDADFSWNTWGASGKKGLKATKSGSSYTLTVKLAASDNCKFVKYVSASSEIWQKSLSGAGASNITYNGGDMDNMIIKRTGTYTFTVTETSTQLNVSVTYSA